MDSIYNSRNYKGLLDCWFFMLMKFIYNSRNYKGLLDLDNIKPGMTSTTVEIIRVS